MNEHYSRKNKCKNCNKPITNQSIFCSKCSNILFPRGVSKERKGTTNKNHAQKIAQARKGKKLSEVHRKSLMVKKTLTPEQREKCKIRAKQNLQSKEARKKFSLSRIGHATSLITRQKISNANKGEKSYLWKGGITPLNKQIRMSLEYKLWRKAVFERDNYQCVFGGKEHGKNLQADHIKPFALFPELRFAIDNGRTLCVECHKKTDTYGGKLNKLL